ncbi:MAG: hypothetical protein GYB66_16575 [Chloroflexi bacterium]|nr:hypothetical protein [Chloroflexota bacterium]
MQIEQRERELTPLARLGEAFDFSMDDLRANRNGTVTRRQRRKVWRRFLASFGTAVGLFLVPVIVGWWLASWDQSLSLLEFLTAESALVGYLTGLLLAGFYISVNISSFLLSVDILRGQVVAVSGPVRRYGHYLFVDQQRFLLEAASLDLIQSKFHYTFYMLPGARHILSIEFAE